MNTLKNIVPLAIASLLIAGFAQAKPIKVHGSSTVYNSFLKEAEAKLESSCGSELEVVPNGSGSGLSDLASGNADMAMISSSIESVASKLNKAQPGKIDLAAYRTYLLMKVEAAFVAHPSNPVGALSGEQLAGLLSGEIKNWSQVGGPDKPVLVITTIPGDGVRSAAESEFLNKFGKSFAKDARVVRSANQVSSIVAQVPHAIGVAGIATVHPGVKVIDSDAKIEQSLFFVTKGDPVGSIESIIETAQAL